MVEIEDKAWEVLNMFGEILGVLPGGKVTESNDVKNCAVEYCQGIIDFTEESMYHTIGEQRFWRNVRDKIRTL